LHIGPVGMPTTPPEHPDAGARALPTRFFERLPIDAGLIREFSDLDMERLIDILEPALAKTTVSPAMPRAQEADVKSAVVTRMTAESKLDQAQQLILTGQPHRAVGWEAKPEALMRVAHHLFESGGAQNYVHAADVSQIVIDMFTPVPVVQTAITQGAKIRLPGSWSNAFGNPGMRMAAWVIPLLVAVAALLYLLER
jgi:hypothetical protein